MRGSEARAKILERMVKSRAWAMGTQADMQDLLRQWIETKALAICAGNASNADPEQLADELTTLAADEFRQFLLSPISEELIKRTEENQRLRWLLERNGIET